MHLTYKEIFILKKRVFVGGFLWFSMVVLCDVFPILGYYGGFLVMVFCGGFHLKLSHLFIYKQKK